MPHNDNSKHIFDTIAIVGVGLIGGSLGMAAKKHGIVRRVIGVGRSEQKLMRAQILGAIDDYTLDMENGASDADLVILCTPVCLVVPTLQKIAGSLKEGAVVTDAGSTKGEIVNQAGAIMPDGTYFVGGHPMAGSEESGVEAAFSDMFLGATYVLTNTDDTDLDALGRMVAFAEAIEAKAEVMSPKEHDLATAIISHLPHAMAAALLQVAENGQRESGKVFRLAAGSFRDLTRISDSPPELWRDISITNAESLIEAIDSYQEHLLSFKDALKQRDIDAIMNFFEEAGQIRKTYMRATN